MEKTQGTMDVSNDVLHIPSQTQLTQEQIAKAVAHHNRHHPDEQQTQQKGSVPKGSSGKKPGKQR